MPPARVPDYYTRLEQMEQQAKHEFEPTVR